MMKPIGDAFSDKFRITILDLPGFGESNEPDRAWSIEDYNSFEKGNIVENNQFPVSKNALDEYYLIDDDFVYKKIADHIELMIQSDEFKGKFYKYPPILESTALVLSRIFSKDFIHLLKGFLFKQDSQIDNDDYWNEERIDKLKNFVNNE